MLRRRWGPSPTEIKDICPVSTLTLRLLDRSSRPSSPSSVSDSLPYRSFGSEVRGCVQGNRIT